MRVLDRTIYSWYECGRFASSNLRQRLGDDIVVRYKMSHDSSEGIRRRPWGLVNLSEGF